MHGFLQTHTHTNTMRSTQSSYRPPQRHRRVTSVPLPPIARQPMTTPGDIKAAQDLAETVSATFSQLNIGTKNDKLARYSDVSINALTSEVTIKFTPCTSCKTWNANHHPVSCYVGQHKNDELQRIKESPKNLFHIPCHVSSCDKHVAFIFFPSENPKAMPLEMLPKGYHVNYLVDGLLLDQHDGKCPGASAYKIPGVFRSCYTDGCTNYGEDLKEIKQDNSGWNPFYCAPCALKVAPKSAATSEVEELRAKLAAQAAVYEQVLQATRDTFAREAEQLARQQADITELRHTKLQKGGSTLPPPPSGGGGGGGGNASLCDTDE